MRLEGMNRAVQAKSLSFFEGDESDVGPDVNHDIARFEEGANEVHVGVPLVAVQPELPGEVGGMQMEPKATQGKGEPPPPAGAPENLRDQKTQGLRMAQQADETMH